MDGPPIFSVRYYDRDWLEDEELLLEDATCVDVQHALAEWLLHSIRHHIGVFEPRCPLKGKVLFQVEVQRGEET